MNDSSFIVVIACVAILFTYLVYRNSRTSKLIVKSNKEVLDQARTSDMETRKSLESIHILVNSNLTAAMQGELNSSRITLASLRELRDFKIHEGFTASEDTAQSIELAALRVKELEMEVSQKIKQTVVADAQEGSQWPAHTG